jgi:nucleotide-binding universal stress UspA family protein
VKAILREAERFTADVVVVGWRGHGPIRRLLMGSVSRGVVRGAKSAVLVVRGPQRVRRIVVGYDGSPTSRRAAAFLDKLASPQNGRVTLVSAVRLMTAPSRGRVPGAAAIAQEIRRMNTTRRRSATRELTSAARRLKRRGWHTRTMVTSGEPLPRAVRTC